MTKRFVTATLFILVLLALSACNQPEDTTLAYLDDIYSGNIADTYGYLCEADRAVISEPQYVTDVSKSLPKFLVSFRDKFSFKVAQVDKKDRNNAKVTIEFAYPDFIKMLNEILGQDWQTAYSDPEVDKKVTEEIKKRYAKAEMPMTSNRVTYSLVRENMRWKLSFSFANKLQK